MILTIQAVMVVRNYRAFRQAAVLEIKSGGCLTERPVHPRVSKEVQKWLVWVAVRNEKKYGKELQGGSYNSSSHDFWANFATFRRKIAKIWLKTGENLVKFMA